MRTRLVLCAALAAAVTVVACENRQITEVTVTFPPGALVDTTSTGCPVGLTMSWSPAALSGPVGTVIDFDGEALVPTGCVAPDIDWTSSNENVVTIDANGRATIVGVGTAEICMVLRADTTVRRCVTVTGTGTATCTISGISINPQNPSVAPSGTVTFTATVTSNPANCGTGVNWNASGGTITSTGPLTATFTAPSTAGNITVTATSRDDAARTASTTVTVTAGPTLGGVPQTLSGSFGNGCVQTLSFTPTVTGVTNPVLVVASSNPSVAGVTTANGVVTINIVGAGTSNITTSVQGTNLSATTALTVTATTCTTTPTLTGVPQTLSGSVGSACVRTLTFTPTVTGVTNPVLSVQSSNPAVATASVSGMTVSINLLTAGTTTITTSVNGTNLSSQTTLTVGNTPCAGAGTFTFNPASVCFSRAQGAPTTATVTVTAADMPAGTVITVESSMPSLVSVSPTSFTFPSATLTLTLAAGTATENGQLILRGNGATGSLPVQVQTAACPGSTTTIDYTPGGGTVSNNTPITLTAQCVQGTGVAACNPFWTSDHPELLTVRGNSTTTVNGQTFYVGTSATLQRVTSGGGTTVQICVQWSLTQTSPRRCYGWVVP